MKIWLSGCNLCMRYYRWTVKKSQNIIHSLINSLTNIIDLLKQLSDCVSDLLPVQRFLTVVVANLRLKRVELCLLNAASRLFLLAGVGLHG